MFNVQGSEIIIILLVALIVLGPEKLPDAIRKFSKFYAEARKMSTGFQSELRNALDEPMRELRDTADLVRKNADFRDLVYDPSAAVGRPAVDPNVDPVVAVEPAQPATEPAIEPAIEPATEPAIEPATDAEPIDPPINARPDEPEEGTTA